MKIVNLAIINIILYIFIFYSKLKIKTYNYFEKEKTNYYLVDASGFGKNCVRECPKKTILDKNKSKCTAGNDDSMINLALVIIGSFLFAIILVMIIFGIRRCKKRRRAAEVMIDDIKEGSLNLI